MPTRFFTNDGDNTLLKKFAGVFEHNPDIERFDVLVGYLHASGYFALRPHLEKVPLIRILVGIEADKLLAQHHRKGILLLGDAESRSQKEQSVHAVLSACQMTAQLSDEIAVAIYPNTGIVGFISAWLRLTLLCGMADEMLGDPHLVSIFRSTLKQNKDQARTLALLDLLLCCGEDEHIRNMAQLQKANHLGVTLAFYWRVAMLYFFRFHRDVDRAALRKFLSEIRKMERDVELPRLI